ncbi:hypothetical protein CR513_16866, partial [Mucuna pruriens]
MLHTNLIIDLTTLKVFKNKNEFSSSKMPRVSNIVSLTIFPKTINIYFEVNLRFTKRIIEQDSLKFITLGEASASPGKKKCSFVIQGRESDLDVVDHWIKEIEKINRVTNCPNELKVTYDSYMLVGEAEYWWQGA